MEATPEGVKADSGELRAAAIRVITECRELSSLSSPSDAFRGDHFSN